MSIKKTVGGVVKRLSKIGEHKAGELHHIEIHPAENGFRVQHHMHKGPPKKGEYDFYGTNQRETVHESAKSAIKECKGICEEHEGSQVQPSEDGKLIGKNDHKDPEEEGDSGY